MENGVVTKVSGPLVIAKNLSGTKIYDLVRVGKNKLFGEVIEIHGSEYSIQAYEETEGIGPGDPVYPTNNPLSVELGPGLIRSIYDGVQRPLNVLRDKVGDFISIGAESPPLDRTKKWHFRPARKIGDEVTPGDILGTVQESPIIEHKIMVPAGVTGKVSEIKEIDATVEETVAKIETSAGTKEITMIQKWPVREPRQVAKKLAPVMPLVTGQRVIDTLFPITKGGTACVPGPFGSGKTVVQHQLAKWSDADIIVYVGCGERGNEMADVLIEFPQLKDPKSGEPLMERTVLIANTSNMPVAAREASVYTGITIAEYYRDMGYSVALMADSTSRWGEAMREISGRLEEMPGEEGFPNYLASRLAGFYERAGNVICLGTEGRSGCLSVIGAVSPPGGDLSEPITQATLRVVKVFWGLDDRLASQRHFPAINWLTSYSLYAGVVDDYCNTNIAPSWEENRKKTKEILQRESELEELVRLVGIDALSFRDRLYIEVAKMIREDFLHQNAFNEYDTYTSLKKQHLILDNIIKFYDKARELVESNVEFSRITSISSKEAIARSKFIPENQTDKLIEIGNQTVDELDSLLPQEVA